MPPLPTKVQAGYYYDSDGDGLDDTYVPDPWEDPAYYGYSTPPSDQDGDGWEDALDPFPADARLNPQTDPDADGVPSELEWFYGMNDLDPADGAADLDGDGFSNAEAFQQGWVLDAALVSPVPDLDGDRLNDITEAHWAQVHPGSLDPGNPLDPVADYDQDGVMNFEELTWGLDLASPTSPATGEDLAFMQLATGDYAAFVTPGYPGYSATDPDADGLHSLLEYQLQLNPRSADSDEDGVPDGEEDADGDGFGNLAEVAAGTLPGQAASHPEASPAGGTGGAGSGSNSGTGNEQGNGNGATGSAVPPVGGTALAATTDMHLRVRSLKVSGGTITRHSQDEWIYTSGSANQSEDMAALTADGWLVDFYTTEVPTGTDPDGLPIGYETWYWWNAKKQVGVAGETILPFSGTSGELASDQAVSEAYADEPGQVYQEDVSGELNLNNPGSGDVFAGWEEGGGVKVVSEFAASKQSTPVSDTGLYPQGEAAEVWVEGSATEVAQRKTYLILGSSTMFQWAPVWQGAGTVTFLLEPGMTGVGRVEAMTGAPPWVSVHNGRLWVEPPVEQGMRNMVRLLPIDLAVDSDNNDGLNPPKRDGAEDAKEDYLASQKPAMENPGKYIKLSTGDFDKDDTPDFADGMDIHGGSGDDKCGKFVPMIADLSAIKSFTSAKVKFEYTEANPTGVTKQTVPNDLPKWSPGSGDLRLWKKNGNEARKIADIKSNGDFVKANTEYSITELGADTQGLLTLYVEAVRKSSAAADKAVTMFIKIDSQSQWIEADKVRFTAIPRVLFGSPYDELTPLPGSKIKPAFEDDTEAEGQELGGTVVGSNGDTLTVGHYGPHPDAESDETKDQQRLAICLQTGADTFTKAEDGIVLLVADGATRGGSLAAAAPASAPPPSNDPPEVNGPEDWEAQFERILFDKYEDANPRVEDLERDAFELWGWLYGGRSWEFFSGRDVWRDGSKIFIEDSLTPEQAADAYYAYLKRALPTEAQGVNFTPILRYFAELYEQSGEDRSKVGEHMAKHWELVDITVQAYEGEYLYVPVTFALGAVYQLRQINNMTFYTNGKVFRIPLIRRNWARGNITEHDTLVNSLNFTRNFGKNAIKVTGNVNGQAVESIPDAIRSQWYIEVKDWKSLSMTRQIRAEFSAAQNANKSVCIIITGRTRKLSQPLMQLIEQEGGLLLRRNLNTDGYEFWNFQTATWEAVEKAIVKSWLP